MPGDAGLRLGGVVGCPSERGEPASGAPAVAYRVVTGGRPSGRALYEGGCVLGEVAIDVQSARGGGHRVPACPVGEQVRAVPGQAVGCVGYGQVFAGDDVETLCANGFDPSGSSRRRQGRGDRVHLAHVIDAQRLFAARTRDSRSWAISGEARKDKQTGRWNQVGGLFDSDTGNRSPVRSVQQWRHHCQHPSIKVIRFSPQSSASVRPSRRCSPRRRRRGHSVGTDGPDLRLLRVSAPESVYGHVVWLLMEDALADVRGAPSQAKEAH